MLGRDELVFHRVGLALGRFEDLDEFGAGCGDPPPDILGKWPNSACDDPIELPAIDADLVEDRADDTLSLGRERGQQVERIDLGIAPIGRQLLRTLDGLLGLDREFVEAKGHGEHRSSCRKSMRR